MIDDGRVLLDQSMFSAKHVKHGFDDRSLVKDLHLIWSALVGDNAV